ncbi:MAG: hypothetical protein Q9191_003606 [Dirinaria sp. TL-2023a]
MVPLDLWGRGYSDNPKELPHDTRLFCSAMLLALASSELCWTGSSRFALVGYSLGGGIAAEFMSFFPYLVSRLILIAPSGLVRTKHVSKFSKLLYSNGVLPEPLLEQIVKKRLKGQPSVVVALKETPNMTTETPTEQDTSINHERLLFDGNVGPPSEFAASDVVAFMSSIRHGPIHSQQPRWRVLREKLNVQKKANQQQKQGANIESAYVLIICGDDDPFVIRDEIFEDAREVLGLKNIELRSCSAGHELPMTNSTEVVEMIKTFLCAA